MTDLELIKACAEAMGYQDRSSDYVSPEVVVYDGTTHFLFAPLTDDAQAMAMVKRFKLEYVARMAKWST